MANMASIRKIDKNFRYNLTLGSNKSYEITNNHGSIQVGNNCTLIIKNNLFRITIGKRCRILECENNINSAEIITGQETTIESVKFNSGILKIGPKSIVKSYLVSNIYQGQIEIGANSKLPYSCWTLHKSSLVFGPNCTIYQPNQDELPTASTHHGQASQPIIAASSSTAPSSVVQQSVNTESVAATATATATPSASETRPPRTEWDYKFNITSTSSGGSTSSASGVLGLRPFDCAAVYMGEPPTVALHCFAPSGIAVTGTGTVGLRRPFASTPRDGENICVICLGKKRNMAFQCGHTCCDNCATQLSSCHICRMPILQKINLYE